MSRLNYHHLHYFWRVATLGNLTEAARQLHVSQSALSAQIRALEESMDTQLFERSGRRLRLTATGQRVLGYANDIFSRGEELESLLRHGIEPEYQQLRIGVLSTMSRNFIEGFIAPLISQPKVRFSLHARGMDNLLNGLATHQFDLILTNSNVAAEGPETLWQSQLLARQPLAVVGPPEQKPAAEFPQGYEGRRWVLPASGTELRSAFDGFCSRWNYEPDVQAEADDMAMLRLLARDTGALTVLPTVVVKDEIAQGTLQEFMTLPNVFESFYAVTVKRQFVSPVLTGLLGQQNLRS
ncbi:MULTISPECIES: LysR family transcriptional regulator [unclassified Thalassolituus]|uniref:LysR family transcriptional regulator n=1 Tax=Oceanospirillaceae TaxID=135620 RepID=UPI000C476E6A|nr:MULTISPECIES: LysR family transcriptional regulator [unclassified Thalassolituus]MCA6059006.1 LysR family transcriptional regulator [Thalassolituus sp. ST750PaO-4]PIQ40591.1 MAG: LysR family transcriptional regulator [Thalassolituus sp. CG17_big_fil_post_rev_8_21_14_2_50_53_8]TVV44641.1 LysR family transcriptional regulator [Thalassolituus sp. C2-1]